MISIILKMLFYILFVFFVFPIFVSETLNISSLWWNNNYYLLCVKIITFLKEKYKNISQAFRLEPMWYTWTLLWTHKHVSSHIVHRLIYHVFN